MREPRRTLRLRLRRPVAVALALLMALAPSASAIDALPEEPSSLNEAVLYHLSFATDVAGVPIEEGTLFAEGSPRVLTLVGWDFVPFGTELRVRLFRDDRLVLDEARTVESSQSSGFIFNYEPRGGVAADHYIAQLDYNGVPDELASFDVIPTDANPPLPSGEVKADGDAAPMTGPVPYADPADVLVVTRESVLRENLGDRTDEVLAAAETVGTVEDLEADGETRDTWEETVPETQRLLSEGDYRYLLILGNDDAVPYVHVPNPVEADEAESLEGWELPADWIPSDNYYADLDGDPWGVPDLPIARLPSSDDADLLLTQLGENVPPDGSTFALVNQKRRNMAGAVLETIDDRVPVETWYSPPVESGELSGSSNGTSRFAYILLHGIGVITDEWGGDVIAWTPDDLDNLDGSWTVRVGGQTHGMTLADAGSPGGIVNVGACYGAWTLDTIQEPQHKTADNNLALAYLKSGTRAFVGDLHLSYSALIGPDRVPRLRTGFEMIFWQEMLAGATPIDAYQAAKVGIAQQIDATLDAGRVDTAALNFKHLHIMVYLGRP